MQSPCKATRLPARLGPLCANVTQGQSQSTVMQDEQTHAPKRDQCTERSTVARVGFLSGVQLAFFGAATMTESEADDASGSANPTT